MQELKKKPFTVNIQNIKQAFGIQVTFILENKPQIEHILANYDCFLDNLCVHFEPLLAWGCVDVCHF